MFWQPKARTSIPTRPPEKSAEQKIILLTKKYVVGTQNNRLNETVLLSPQNMLKLMDKKIYAEKFCLITLSKSSNWSSLLIGHP